MLVLLVMVREIALITPDSNNVLEANVHSADLIHTVHRQHPFVAQIIVQHVRTVLFALQNILIHIQVASTEPVLYVLQTQTVKEVLQPANCLPPHVLNVLPTLTVQI